MKKKLCLLSILGLVFTACHPALNIAKIDTQKNIVISSEIKDEATYNAVIAPYKKSMEAQMNTKISHTNKELTKIGDNSDLGNLLADFTYLGAEEWAKKNNIPHIDAAVINIGGIRSTIGQGDIYLKSVYEVMPFENEVVLVEMTGSQLKGLFNYYATTQKNNPVSHLLIETQDGKLIKSLIDGKPINDNETYYIATSDYLALGGDNMKFFSKGKMISTGMKLRDLFINYFKANPEIQTNKDTRLIFNKTKK